jgi:dGTPase
MNRQIREYVTGVHVFNYGSLWHMYLEIFAPPTMKILAHSVDTIAGAPMGMIPECQQRRDIVIGYEPHRSAVTTVASIGTAKRNRTFSPKTYTTGSTVTTKNIELGFINKYTHRGFSGYCRHCTSRSTYRDVMGDGQVHSRTESWAETMHGNLSDSNIRLAHLDSWAGPGSTHLIERLQREASEDAHLSPLATRSFDSGNRAVAEEPDPFRTCFERDRDRILHASAFRRLAGKTQVFVFPQDHQRTRLTHALEVTQVATALSRALGLNVSLTEAIALGHDCGHGPGGHASEDALGQFVKNGFDHAVWGADVTLSSLNLCTETLDGIRNHSWSRPAPSTPEGEVVSWADRIAYVCHDFEDAVAAGIVSPEQLPDEIRSQCGTTRSSQLRAFISAMIGTTTASGLIGMSPITSDALAQFRKFNYENIYMREASRDQATTVINLLRALVEHYIKFPQLIGDTGEAQTFDHDIVHDAVAYVGGMTDRFACRQAVALLGWTHSQLPRGIDTN